ncbi:MAG: hypothetical protein ACI8RZ_007975 [Myxococcota bacterium]|jgi:hypothetical protein
MTASFSSPSFWTRIGTCNQGRYLVEAHLYSEAARLRIASTGVLVDGDTDPDFPRFTLSEGMTDEGERDGITWVYDGSSSRWQVA